MSEPSDEFPAAPCEFCRAEGTLVPLLGTIWKCGTHAHCGRRPVRTRECISAELDLDAMEPWFRRWGDKPYQYELAHAWCLPAKYVDAGWEKGNPLAPGGDECDICRKSMEVSPR